MLIKGISITFCLKKRGAFQHMYHVSHEIASKEVALNLMVPYFGGHPASDDIFKGNQNTLDNLCPSSR